MCCLFKPIKYLKKVNLKVNKPLLSVITVCYNSEKTIKRTIESLLVQSFKGFEYIIIDGKSSDKTIEIIKSYEKEFKKNKICFKWISEKDKGLYDAINKGISLASGDIIANLNSDDFYIDENVISDVVSKFEGENTDLLYSDLYYVDPKNTNKVIRNWKSGKYNRNNFLFGWMPPHPTFFVRSELYKKYGTFNLALKSAADYELMLRFLFKHGASASYIHRPLVRMRVGGVSNASLKNRWKANQEDRKAWKINQLKPNPFTLILKPLRKLKQFIK